MPADYNSTAKALALPTSPSHSPSPSPSPEPAHPPWSRRISSSSRRLNNSSPSYQTQILESAHKVRRQLLATYNSLSAPQKVAVAIASVVAGVLGILVLVYSEAIFGFLAPAAKRWHDVTGGWLILWALTFACAFPPIIGYSTTVTIAGFVYGFPRGWFIAASATVAGSLCSFLASRTVLSGYVQRLVGQDKRFEALSLVLRHDGLKILAMIRFCPLPYSLSNAAMSTFPTVHPLSFALATAIASPKLLIHVFIGSRLAAIGEGQKMDAGTKAVNYISIVVGSVLGAAVGWIIYQRTIKRAKELEIEELEAGQREGGGPPGADYSDEGERDDAVMMDPDDISLWENGDVDFGDEERDGTEGYRDDASDDEDVFASGDGQSKKKGKAGGR